MADTEGTNRDFDESRESKNQGHGTPREKRGNQGDAGESNRVVREDVRGRDGVGGKVRRKIKGGDEG